MEKYERIWAEILEIIAKNVTPISFDTWFKEPLNINKIDNELKIVYLEVSANRGSDLALNILKDRYIPYLEDAFKDVLKEEYKVVIKLATEYEKPVDNSEEIVDNSRPKRTKKTLDKQKLFNPKFTFENFVVGNSNKLAHAAALAVAESPSEAYNPLFIYGGSGLGKTHLLNAIGIYLLESNPAMNVLYVSSEMFTNELIKAIAEKKMSEFKSKYRQVDVLLVDDIQFLEGKENMQEEFFHTFNTLYDANKQIIISGDRAPSKLENLDDRLRSRFQWNLLADIQPPDYETRVAILLKKAENLGLEQSDDLYEVVCLLSEKIKDNIRELEGAFTRSVSFSTLLGEKLDKAFVKRTLKDVMNSGEITITPEKIKKVVCKEYGIKLAEIESSKKTNNIAFPRQIAMYLMRDMTDLSLPKIGEYFGGRHYTTIMYACTKIEDEIKQDPEFAILIENIKEKIKD